MHLVLIKDILVSQILEYTTIHYECSNLHDLHRCTVKEYLLLIYYSQK